MFQVSLGTVANVEEAVKWLSYTYLYVRMRANPLVYGVPYQLLQVGISPSSFSQSRSQQSAEITRQTKMVMDDGTLKQLIVIW